MPEGYHVVSDGDMLWWKTSGSYARATYDLYVDRLDEAGGFRERRDPRYQPITHDEIIAAVANKAMDELQDSITEETREPWPGDRTVPGPNAIVENGFLLMWFGDRNRPALQLDPIELAELEPRADQSAPVALGLRHRTALLPRGAH